MNCQINTRFSDLGFYSSIAVVATLLIIIVYGIIVCRPMLPADKNVNPKDADLKLYQNIAEQIHSGTGYYQAADKELRRMGYATHSVFNWRLPPLAWLLGHLPSIKTGQILAVILSFITLVAWLMIFHRYRYGQKRFLFGGLILSGPLIYALTPGPFLSHEFWAGTLITLSLAVHQRGWRFFSALSGLTALFLRELSLPFVLVMMTISYIEGQRREALIWFIGILVFSGELFLHWSIVSTMITESDLSTQGGWIVFSGWPFVLHTAQMNAYLFLAPPWLTAIILPLSVLGLAGWRDALGLRVFCTVGIYVLSFLIVGRPENKYWGLMYAFFMPLGLLYAPYALKDLFKSIRRKVKAHTERECAFLKCF